MKIVKYLFNSVFVLCFSVALNAQQPNTTNTSMTQGGPGNVASTSPELMDVYSRENIIPTKKPIPYPYLREADVMWSKDIWRTIDLRQRMNYPLRFPEVEIIGDRYSLYQLLMEGLRSGEITPYEFQSFNNPFIQPTTLKQIHKTIEADTIEDDNGNVLSVGIKSTEVKQFYMKEKWYFDKQHSEMRVRITALAPVMFLKNYDPITGDLLPNISLTVPFVVYFPQCRNLFATHPIFNSNNDAQNISFDDLFMQRRFASRIFSESNEFSNRPINSYTTGQDALMEAERIKNDLFLMEHDLWEY